MRAACSGFAFKLLRPSTKEQVIAAVDVIIDVTNGVAPVYEKLAKNELMVSFISGCQNFIRFEPESHDRVNMPCAGEPAALAIVNMVERDLDRKTYVARETLEPLHLYGFTMSSQFRQLVDNLTDRVVGQMEQLAIAPADTSETDIFKKGLATLQRADSGVKGTRTKRNLQAMQDKVEEVASSSAASTITRKSSVFMTSSDDDGWLGRQ